uniref:Uncharacterized protein n=1 Tax=Davidia involucrata TaxID=16924 RepID=A0A5B6ZK72_DAVIN
MRCKKHLTDLSSNVGVCASCLRERLFALIAAQAQSQARAQARQAAQEDRRKSDSHPPPLIFPRSVSPYICRRKSDNSDWNHDHRHHHSLSDQRFYSTPQVGPTGAIVTASSYKKKHSKFSLFSNLFRSKSEKTDSDHRVSVSNSGDSCTASSSSVSWFSSILSVSRKKQSRLFSLDESTAAGVRRPCRNRDRGMSPARYSNDGENEECCERSSGYSSESSQGWKQTPRRAAPPVRPGGRPSHSRNVSGLAFCLSPLVRASPNRHWNQKGMPPDMAVSGEIKVPVKPHLSTAASFCANRSRKLADFGRFNHNQ